MVIAPPPAFVDVTLPVRDLNRELDWALPEEDASRDFLPAQAERDITRYASPSCVARRIEALLQTGECVPPA